MRGRAVGAFFNTCVCCLLLVFSAGHRRSPESYRLNLRFHTGACSEVPAQNSVNILGVICFIASDCVFIAIRLISGGFGGHREYPDSFEFNETLRDSVPSEKIDRRIVATRSPQLDRRNLN